MKVLVVKLSSLGDVLHALPTAAELKTQLGAEIHWAVQPAFAPLVRCFACVDEVVEVPRPSSFHDFLRALRGLRTRRYDLVADLQGLAKSAIVARAARAPRRIGPSFAREGSPLLYHELAGPRNKDRHAIEECLDLVRHLGLETPAEPRFPLNVPTVDLDTLAPLAGDGPRIAIAPASRWDSKNWPEAHFGEFARRAVENHGARLYLVGGANDAPLADRVAAAAGDGASVANLCGRLALAESLGALARCEALLTNDSGPMHMAAALGVKCVALFGPTLPGRTGPYGDRHVVLRVDGCPPCHRRICPKDTKECLHAITPAMAEAAVFTRTND
ncbi:MAG: glycosyltransferase family 9 protein [Kiritimatiellia bacterium]|jgi:heptosyltransferase-1